MIQWLRRLLCSHEVYFEDLNRVSDDLVEGRCHKCTKVLSASHGLALRARLMGYRPKGSSEPQPGEQKA